MRLKLDENFSKRTVALVQSAGHDVHTVHQENLRGAPDIAIYTACRTEGRCLVSLDLDFADVVRFPPHLTGGIAVLRVPKGSPQALIELLVQNLLAALKIDSIEGRLWIVEANRTRIHSQTDPNRDDA